MKKIFVLGLTGLLAACSVETVNTPGPDPKQEDKKDDKKNDQNQASGDARKLSSLPAQEACDVMKKAFSDAIPDAVLIGASCNMTGGIAYATSQGTAEEKTKACDDAVASCKKDSEVKPDDCSKVAEKIKGCEATIAQVKTCFQETGAQQKAIADTAVCTGAKVDLPKAPGCDAIRTTCASLFKSD
jgi:hypothetical protein